MYIHERVDVGDDYEQEFAEGTTLEYRCGPGYFPRSIQTWKVICERTYNGSLGWRIGDNDCRPVSCGHPGEVRWGRLLDAVFAFPKRVRYQCNHGYRLIGAAQLYCQSNGRWSGSKPECRIVDCGPLQGIANGSLVLSGTEFGSRAEFSCSKCFRLVGNSTRTCDADGKWTGQSPKCEEIRCNPPQIPLGGDNSSIVSEARGNLCGARIWYTCPSGTALIGSDINTCVETGTWLFNPPICTPKCIVNRSYGSVVLSGWTKWTQEEVKVGTEVTEQDKYLFVKCEEGFHFSNPSLRYKRGQVNLECKNGRWNPGEPWCTEEPCKNLYNLVKGGVPVVQEVQHGQEVKFYCDQNHVQKNKVHLTTVICQRGKVSGDLDLCEPKSCSNMDLPFVENGRPLPNQNFPHKSAPEYDCDEGFKLQKGQLQCWYGTWQGTKPKCTPISCNFNSIPRIENGRPQRNQNVSHGAVASYHCADGFQLQNHGEVICSFGKWNIIEAPKCVQSNGQRSFGPYYIKDHHTRHPRSGCRFPKREPRFVAHLKNARIFPGMEVPDGAELRFHCNPVGKFLFTGSRSAFCNNGSWNWTEEPYCRKLRSDDISMEFQTDNYAGPGGVVYVEPGKQVNVLCFTHGKHLVELFRQPGAKEDQYIPDYARNSVLAIFKVGVDEAMHLICRRNDLKYRRSIVIVGRYKYNCPMPPHGNGLIIKNTTKANFEFSCVAPYNLHGKTRVYCLPHGEWEYPLPHCGLAQAGISSPSTPPVVQGQDGNTTHYSTGSTMHGTNMATGKTWQPVTAPMNLERQTPRHELGMSVQNGQSAHGCSSHGHCARAGENVHVTSSTSVPAMEDLNSFQKPPAAVEAEAEHPVDRAPQNTGNMYASSHREDGSRLYTPSVRVQYSGSPPRCPSPHGCLHDKRIVSDSQNISSEATSSESENTQQNARSSHTGPRPAKPPVDDRQLRGSTIPMNSSLPNARDIGTERHDATATNAANMSAPSSDVPNGTPQPKILFRPDPDADSVPTSPNVGQTYGIPHATISPAVRFNRNESTQGPLPPSPTDLGSDLEQKTSSSGCSLQKFYHLAPPGVIIHSDANPAPAMSNFSASCDGADLTFIGRGSLVTCLENGSWAFPVNMNCIKGCDNFDTGPEGPIVEGRKAVYQLADSLTLSCRNGTRLHPRVERIICLGREQGWSEDKLPTCVPVPKNLPAAKTPVKRRQK